MSFLKKMKSRSKSTVELPEDSIRVQKMEEKRQKRNSVHVSGFKTRGEWSPAPVMSGQAAEGGSDDDLPDQQQQKPREKERERERKKHKDMSGLTAPSSGPAKEYPTFLVHYLGRMPTSLEYGRDAVEGPVGQLIKLREHQKLARIMVHFDPEGLRCWEVGGPFLKARRDGFALSVPLHHITYGVGSNDHPNIFACIVRMNADPGPDDDQMLILHAFLCAKPDITQKLTYWQLQAYIEAYEDLKRKRILRDRRRKAIAGQAAGPSTSTTTTSSSASSSSQPQPAAVAPVRKGGPPASSAVDPSKEVTEVKIKGKGKVKVKASASSSSADGEVQNGPSRAVGRVLDGGGRGASISEDDPTEVFVEPPGATTGTMVHRARIVSRPRLGSGDGGLKNGRSRDREDSVSSNEGEGEGKEDCAQLERRIGNMQGFMEMDADMLKKLMITEHPTIARRISCRTAVDPQDIFHSDKMDLAADTSDA